MKGLKIITSIALGVLFSGTVMAQSKVFKETPPVEEDRKRVEVIKDKARPIDDEYINPKKDIPNKDRVEREERTTCEGRKEGKQKCTKNKRPNKGRKISAERRAKRHKKGRAHRYNKGGENRGEYSTRPPEGFRKEKRKRGRRVGKGRKGGNSGSCSPSTDTSTRGES